MGTGYMGSGLMTLLTPAGRGKIIAVDPRAEARENALRFGADEIYTPRIMCPPNISSPNGMTRCMTGASRSSANLPVRRVRFGWPADMTAIHGTMGVGGWHQGGDRTVDFRLWGWKASTVINTHERREAFQAACCQNALDLLCSGMWNFKGVSNHIYGLNEFDRANEELANKPKGYIKGLVICSDW